MAVIIKTNPGLEKEFEDVTLGFAPNTSIACGEYANQGEPNVLVRVVHAIDHDGNDVQAEIARRIAEVLATYEAEQDALIEASNG